MSIDEEFIAEFLDMVEEMNATKRELSIFAHMLRHPESFALALEMMADELES